MSNLDTYKYTVNLVPVFLEQFLETSGVLLTSMWNYGIACMDSVIEVRPQVLSEFYWIY